MDLVEARGRIGERRRIPSSRVRDNDYFPFEGGLNLVDAPLRVAPGQFLGCQNYEPYYRGGYRRVEGYERLDGQLKPSEALYTAIELVDATPANYPDPGDIVNGATSGATGTVLAITARNMMGNSQELDEWSLVSSATATVDVIEAPDGTMTADRLTESVTYANHFARHNPNLDPGTYTWSVHIKPGERTVVLARAQRASDAGNMVDSYIDLATGLVTLRGGGTAEVFTRELANGWWRIYSSFTLAAADTVRLTIYLSVVVGSPSSPSEYTGDGVSGLYLWGLQITPGAALTDYRATDNGPSASLYLARVTGTFVDGENLREGTTVFGTEDGVPLLNTAPDEEHYDYVVLAHADARALIEAVPGSGPVRGVVQYGSRAYAIRDTEDGTLSAFWRSSASGWEAIALGLKLRFTDGIVRINEGDVVVGNTSGATATATRIGLRDGDWNGSPLASGYVIFASVASGPFQDGETLRVGSTDVAIADGGAFTQTLQPGGTWEFRIFNFIGHTRGIRLYGVSGEDKCIEYDDDDGVFAKIETGMDDDRPIFLATHLNILWLAFRGGSLQRSSTGLPLEWRVLTGTAELGIGGDISGMLEEVSDTLFVFTHNRTYYVSGTSNADFQLKPYSPETGGMERTLQRIGQGVILDDRGFTSLATTDRFGNYVANSFSFLIAPLLEKVTDTGLPFSHTAVASVISRRLNLYRCFFSGKEMLSIGFAGTKVMGITASRLPITVHCASNFEDAEGREVILLGATDGFVYQMDPTMPALSFDGLDIEAAGRLVFHHSRSPSRLKRYRRGQIDVATQTPIELQMSVDYSFAGPLAESDVLNRINVDGGGGFWDVHAWNTFKWDIGPVQSAVLKLEGSGTNMGLLIYSKSDRAGAHVISGISLTYSQRRLNRGSEP